MNRLFITDDLITTKDEKYANCLNYLYYIKQFNEKSKTTRWTCPQKKCFASITTTEDKEIIKINGNKCEEDTTTQLKIT
jgi:hypothetical protein